MVMAGIRKVKIQGANRKKGAKSAKPELGILNSPSKTQRNNPVTTRNKLTTKYPIGEAKNELISFFNIANKGYVLVGVVYVVNLM
jgi:hypothetical protein